MKIALVVVVLALALGLSEARFFGRVGGFGFGRGFGFGGLGFGRGFGFGGLGFGRWGLGWGGPWGMGLGWGGPWGFGRWGLGWGGPWGMGRWGLGWGGPWGAFGAFNPLLHPAIAPAAIAPAAGLGVATAGLGLGVAAPAIVGKRAVDDEVIVPSGERTLCSFTTKKNVLSCNGPKHNFECEVMPHFVGLSSPSYRVHNLTVVPETVKASSTEHTVYRLFSFRPEDNVVNRFTLIEKPERRVTFSVYRSESIKENGLRIVNEKCWNSFNTMINEVRPEHVRFALFITNITPKVVV